MEENNKVVDEVVEDELPPLSLWEVIGGVLAMAIGVRSKERRIRDFRRGKFIHFAIAGVILALLFILTVASVVVFTLS
ncbi:MAG: DUF2970 domain-containing protein [Porticoccaceae bacterium]